MPTRSAYAFLKTAFYGCSLLGKDVAERNQIKQKWARSVLRTLGFQLRIEGKPPAAGSAVLVGNHLSYLDIPVIIAAEPYATFVSKDDLLRWPIIGAGAKAAGTIFISREPGSDRSVSRQQVIGALTNGTGAKIAVFPAGTTSLNESKPWKKGVFEIAQEARVPVQLFRIEYQPLREAAYVDDDNLLSQMTGLSKIKNKSVTLTWLDRFDEIDQDPAIFAEALRDRVSRHADE